MAIRLVREQLTRCSICGVEIVWDEGFDSPPLCVECWDDRSGVDNELAAAKRVYREANKERLAAAQRVYYEANKERLAKGGK